MNWKILLMALTLVFICHGVRAGEEIIVDITAVQENNRAVIDTGGGEVAPGMVFNILGEDGQAVVGTLTILEVSEGEAAGIFYMTDESLAAPSAGMKAVFGREAQGADQGGGADIIIPKGSIVEITLDSDISSQLNKTGDVINFTVAIPVSVGGLEVISAGATVFGEITEAKPAKGYGKSGKLDFTIKYVDAADGTKVPLAFEVENKKGNSYAKAALGAYMTGFLGGGAMKGKKITIAKGTIFRVYTPEDTKLRATSSVQPGVSGPKLVMREKRDPADIRIAFLGLHDSFNESKDTQAAYTTDKIATFITYKLMWETQFDFIKPRQVADKVSSDFNSYFLGKEPGIPAAQRYNLEKITALGKDLGADYVMVGDILKYTVTEQKKHDTARSIINILSIASGGATMDSAKMVFEMQASMDIAIVDVQSGEIFWNEKCDGEHKVSKWLDRTEPKIRTYKFKDKYYRNVFKVKDTYYGLVKDIDYDYSFTEDPIAFSGTEEGVAVTKIINPFLIELPNLF